MRVGWTGAFVVAACLGGGARAADPVVPAHPEGVTEDTRERIRRGLEFLAREQNDDGSWRSAGGLGSYPVAMTGLAALAVTASGSTPTRGPYAKNVRRATDFLLKQQQPNGLITAPIEESRSMYGHGFATLFLAQVYGMEEDERRQRQIHEALRKAVELTARAQSNDGGWIYTPDARSDEGSVTVTQVQALRACRNAGVHVPKEVVDKAVQYIEKSQNPDGGISYSLHSKGSRPALTAAACAVLYNAGAYDSPAAEQAFDYAWRHCLPSSGAGNYHYYYTQLYMSQACWQKGAEYWPKYFDSIQDVLFAQQQGNGSWMGDGVGPTYGTAIALLILQLPFNQLPILSR